MSATLSNHMLSPGEIEHFDHRHILNSAAVDNPDNEILSFNQLHEIMSDDVIPFGSVQLSGHHHLRVASAYPQQLIHNQAQG